MAELREAPLRYLLARERCGRIYLTDTGLLMAKDLLWCVEVIRERLPELGLEMLQESSVGEHSNLGTLFFAAGFTVTLALDAALGLKKACK